ncbi:YfhE family protein [Sporosarcina sp. G11-34]|nr:YfhE family protein [Sporosarcina sp. G11-34]MCZ2258219.1 YfhE family protein [Sporosarcina sp. G11-34]
MAKERPPHERMTDKNNGLTSAQEVLYNEEFKKADNAVKNKENKKK